MAGRPMKPIPDDAPPELARLAELLRDVCLAADGPTLAAIAERAGVAKSTLRHALGGERLPNMETVLGLVAACQDPAVEAVVRQDERMRAAVLWREAYRAVNADRLRLSGTEGAPRELAVANRLIQGHAARTQFDSAADVDRVVRLREDRLAAQAALDAAVERLGQATAAVAVARAALRAASAAEHEATAAGAGTQPPDPDRARNES